MRKFIVVTVLTCAVSLLTVQVISSSDKAPRAVSVKKSIVTAKKRSNPAPDSAKLMNPIAFSLKNEFGGGLGIKSVQVSPKGDLAVACDLEGSSFWVIDLKAGKIREKITFDRSVVKGYNDNSKQVEGCIAEKPVDCAIDSAGRFVFVSLYNGDAVVKYNLLENETPATEPSRKFWVTKELDGKKTRLQLPAAATGHMPKMVSVIPGTNLLMTTNWVSGSVTFVDCDKMKAVKNVTIGSGAHQYPRGIAIDREKNIAYVNNMGGGTVTVFDLGTLSIVKSIPITSNPGHMQLSTDRKSFYVCDNRNKLFSQYSTETGKLMRQVGTEFNALLFSTDKNQDYAVVLHWYNSAATIIDLKTFKAVRQFKIRMPIGISFTANQCLITTYGGGDGRVSVFEW